jgi:hypothetical protein
MSDEKDQMDKKAESSGSLKSTTDQDIEYKKSKEYILKQEQINVSRLKLARYWLAIVTTYYIFRCIFVIFPRFERRTPFVQSIIVVQLVGMCLVTLGMVASFYHISIIKPLLYIQAVQMALSNFNGYVEENTLNFEGLNMLSTVFSVLFAVFNCYIASMVIYDYRVKAICTMGIFGLVQYIIIQTNFIFGDITYHTTVSLIISIAYTCIMIPAFGWIS